MTKRKVQTPGEDSPKRKARRRKKEENGSNRESQALVKTQGGVGTDLSVKQCQAAYLLTQGVSVTDIAAHLEVDPSTIHRWKRCTPSFRATLSEFKQQVLDAAQSQLIASTIQVANNIADEIKRGNAAISLKVLEKIGVLALPTLGSDDPITEGHNSLHAHYQRTISEGNVSHVARLVDAIEEDQGQSRRQIEALLEEGDSPGEDDESD